MISKPVRFVWILLLILPQTISFITRPRHSSQELYSHHHTLHDIDRIYCLSDLHTDHVKNLEWIRDELTDELTQKDLLIVAGDISHNYDVMEETLQLLRKRCQVFFIFGNHEAWLTSQERNKRNSLQKINKINKLCHHLGVHTDLLYIQGKHPVWVVPIQSWYDGSLTFNQELCSDFNKWPWVDFQRCNWTSQFPPAPRDDPNSKIPKGLVDHFHERNEGVLKHLAANTKSTDTIMTVSHFLPNVKTLPDWKDVEEDTFNMNEWLDHGAGGVSAKFAKVAGSALIDEQIRSMEADHSRLLHIFGHSHRPKDFEWEGIRYIHNPLGKPRQRSLYMIAPDVNAQLIWNLNAGEVKGETIIRLWEQYGGGKEALIRRLEEIRPGRYKRH